MTDEKEKGPKDWLEIADSNLTHFEKSPLHETLRTPRRDTYTAMFEDKENTLKMLRDLCEGAHKADPAELSMSRIEAPWACWEHGTRKAPLKIALSPKNGPRLLSEAAYRFVYAAANAVLLDTGDMVRHQCDNRKCIRPDHLLIGSREQNREDDKRRRYAGKGPGGAGQALSGGLNTNLEDSPAPPQLDLGDETDVR